MMNDTNRQFFKVGAFRAWVPVIFFIGYWLNSYFHYQFGLLIRDPLRPQTHIYFIANLIVFILMYRLGIGVQQTCMLKQDEEVWSLNRAVFRYIPVLCAIVSLAYIVRICDRFMTGAGSIVKTLEETEFVREEITASPLTTIAMLFSVWEVIYWAIYFLALASRYPMKRWIHILSLGIGLSMCFLSFLSANRGNFFVVCQYIAFYLLYAKGARIKDLLWKNNYLVLRVSLIAFIAIAITYFFFISRYRGSEDGLRAYSRGYKEYDRYGLFQTNVDELDLSAFFLTYTYMSEGYQYIDLFLRRGDPFYFRPLDLVGGRVLRQFRRVIPLIPERPQSVEIGNSWRESAGYNTHGWPTIWGWNICMFGYIGGVMFMGFLAYWLGWCSQMFLKTRDVTYLITCLAWYLCLMNSFNSIWADVGHYLAYWVGFVMILNAKRRWLRFRYLGRGRYQ